MIRDDRPSGLHSPGPMLRALERPKAWTARRIAVQSIVFGLSLVLIGWVISLVFSRENRQRLADLEFPSPVSVVLLIAGSAVSVVATSMVFCTIIRPRRRIPALDLIAINSIATLLSVVPFKLGLVVRVAIHHKRDRLTFREIVPWFAAVFAITLAVMLPVGLAGLWRQRTDLIWTIVSVGGIGACLFGGYALSRLAARLPLLRYLSLGASDYLADLPTLIRAGAWRIADIGAQGIRFVVASQIAASPMQVDQAILYATTYYFIGVLAPTGATGFQLGGTVGLAFLQGVNERTIGLIALIVTTGDFAASVLMAGAGSLYLLRSKPVHSV